jgi:ActR/RegA family two-component response regulator
MLTPWDSAANLWPIFKTKTLNIGHKRILLIDDEEVILFGFKEVLAEPWLEVDTANTAAQAKSLLALQIYAGAVVDLRLSNSTDLEGLELISCIRSIQDNCRIIVLTGYSEEPAKREALNSGADLFLEKPVDPARVKQDLRDMGVY